MSLDLSTAISRIMENPELVAEIKRLAENSEQTERTEDAASAASEVKVEEVAKEESTPASIRTEVSDGYGRHDKRRATLLRALSPYMSGERQRAIETFMTIADVLDTMRAR